MHLIWSTSELLLGNKPSPGFPIVLNEDMTSCWPANEFLRHYLRRAKVESKKSWEQIARAIYDYFGFLEAHAAKWDAAPSPNGPNNVAAYRIYSKETVNLRPNTIRLRLIYISEFYKFALRRKWIAELPFLFEEVRYNEQGFLAHTSSSGGKTLSNSEMPRASSPPPKFLSPPQVRVLLKSATNPHHRAIIRLALATGLRRQELATFPLTYLSNPSAAPSGRRNLQLDLDPNDGHGMKTKGSKPGTIYIDARDMQALWNYRKTFRGQREGTSDHTFRELFLNQDGTPWSQDGKGIEAMVRNLGKRAGFKVSPHMLRHTFAVRTLIRNRMNPGPINELVFLQNQLRHSSLTTTMTYVKAVNKMAEDVILAYSDEIDSWLEGG